MHDWGPERQASGCYIPSTTHAAAAVCCAGRVLLHVAPAQRPDGQRQVSAAEAAGGQDVAAQQLAQLAQPSTHTAEQAGLAGLCCGAQPAQLAAGEHCLAVWILIEHDRRRTVYVCYGLLHNSQPLGCLAV